MTSLHDDIMILHCHALFGTNSPNMAGKMSCNNTLLHIDLIHNNDWSTYKYSKNEPSFMKSYVKVRADLELENGLLYRRIRLKDHEEDTYQLVVPVAYRKTALELLHDKFGHLGIDRTTGLICERFFWPRMAEEIRQYI